jgi:DNA-binding MarR family transcriptional regulator
LEETENASGDAILVAMGTHGDSIWRDGEQRAWLAWNKVQLRLSYEVNRRLQAESELSTADYDVLTERVGSPGERLPISVLANKIGWERSRVSHHVKRMAKRSLVTSAPAKTDRRVTEVALTRQGRRVLEEAAPGHVAQVRQLFFGGLPPELVPPLTSALENIYEHVIEHGTLPPPDC